MTSSRALKLSETFLRIVHNIIENQKRPRRYGIAEQLYPAEIHTLMMIGANKGMHASELARFLGVTRGAVSQMILKLAKKGLIKKTVDPENATRALLALTGKGKIAFDAHQQMHAEKDAALFEYIAGLSDDQYAFAQGFLEKLEEMIDRLR